MSKIQRKFVSNNSRRRQRAKIGLLEGHGIWMLAKREDWRCWLRCCAAASKPTDVMTSSTKEALGNMRELAEVREPAAYAQAFTGFMQAQMQLAQSTAAALFEVAQGAGEQMSAVGSTAADKATTAARKTTRSASARKTSSTAA